MCFTAAIFFGSGLRPLTLHWCPKKETCGSLNCILSRFRVKVFFLHTSKKFTKCLVMFLVISPIDDHVISYACNSRNAEENCIQFPLEHILCNNGTYWKSSPLKSSNVLGPSLCISLILDLIQPSSILVKVSDCEPCHSMEFSHNFLNGMCIIRLSLQGLVQVSRTQVNPKFLVHRVSLGCESYWNQLEASFP